MADSSKIIEFIFQGVDKTSDALDSITNGLDQMNSQVGAAAQPFADVTESLIKFEAALAVVTAAVLGFAINEAVKFESAMFDLKKVLDDTDPPLKQLGDTAIEMSNKFGVSSVEVVKAFADFKEAGFSAAEAVKLVDATLTAVNVSELTAAQSADIFRRILAGFSAPASDVAEILDVLNEVSNEFGTNVGQLGEAMARSAPIAKQMGFSYEELSAVLTPMIEIWQNSEQVATAFSTVMQRLVGNSKPVVDQLKQLGISQTDVNGKMKLGKDILHEVQLAFQTLDPAMKTVVAQELAGVEQSAKMITAFDGLEKQTKVLAVATDAAGSAQKELAVRMEATEFQVNKMTTAFDNAAILLGTKLLPGFDEVVKALGNLGNALQTAINTGAFDPLIEAINAAMIKLAEMINLIATNLPKAVEGLDFTLLINALQELAASFGGLFSDIDLTTPEGLTAVLQEIIDTITTMVQVTKGISDVLVPLIKKFVEWALAGNDLSPALKELGGNILGVGTVVVSLAAGIAPLIAAFSAMGSVIVPLAAGGAILASGFAQLVTSGLSLANSTTGLSSKLFDLAHAFGLVSTPAENVLDLQTKQVQALALQVPKWDSLNASVSLIGGTFESTTDTMIRMEDIQTKQVQALALQVPKWKELDDSVSLIGGTFKKSSDDIKKSTETSTQAIDDLLQSWGNTEGVAHDSTLATDLFTHGITSMTKEVFDAETGTTKMVTSLTNVGPAATDAGDKAEKALSKTAKEALEAQKATNQFELEWRKIESEEKKLEITTNAAIIMAQIVAGTEQVKAAFESVNVTIESTGNTLVGLAGILADIGSGPNAGVIIDLLEQENKRRQEALDLQKKLVEAQIQYLDAVVKRMTQGDAMITVTADGLEPELEAFMFKILERIQVQASAEAQQFLLGL